MQRRQFIQLSSIAGIGLLSSLNSFIPVDESIKGIYLTGWKGVGTSSINSTIEHMKRLDLNTILIDVKNAHGELFYEPRQVRAKNLQIKTDEGHVRKLNIDYLVNQAQKNNIRLVARHVMFRDKGLYIQEPQWQLHKENNEYWVDMRNQDVVDYNLSLLEQESKMGFDEIALDYIRYPAVRAFDPESRRCVVIDDVVKQAKAAVSDIDLGVQIFGYSAWHHSKARVGQRMETLAEHADVIYPMIYPSHFWPGSFGYKSPSDNPYVFIDLGCKAAAKLTDEDTKVIPMLQAFDYPAHKITAQIKACDDNSNGYVFWNSSSDYKLLDAAYSQLK